MIKKVYVPKYLYPLSAILYNYIITLIALVVLIPLCIYCRVAPTVHVFGVIVPLILLLLLTYGVGMILATVTVFFRDMEYLWDVILMIIMYSSAIFYYPEKLMKSGYAWILKFNPLYGVIKLFRDAILGNAMNMHYVLYVFGFSCVVLLVGHLIFYKKQDQFILQI